MRNRAAFATHAHSDICAYENGLRRKGSPLAHMRISQDEGWGVSVRVFARSRSGAVYAAVRAFNA